MNFIQAKGQPIHLELSRDLTKSIKQGHPWLYRSAFKDLPQAESGTLALIKYKKKIIATGYYSPESPIAVRICTQEGVRLDDQWVMQQLQRAGKKRQIFKDSPTNAFRLINGEGDGLPGLTCDIYNQYGVIQLDGHAPAAFWETQTIAKWLCDNWDLKCIIEKNREAKEKNKALIGDLPQESVKFTEHGLHFQADIVQGQKTGFFLDQRENRQLIRSFSRDKTVLNLFSYTGGFSTYAGSGGAKEVTSVDIAHPATCEAENNWNLNSFKTTHHAVQANVFEFLQKNKGQQWDLVIVDPPSFASSEKSIGKAASSYKEVFQQSIKATKPQGLVALSSCSSHIDFPSFLQIAQEALSLAGRRGQFLSVQGQPFDHPFPVALKEYRYLKFALIELNN